MKRKHKILLGLLAGVALAVLLVITGIVNPLLEKTLDNYAREQIRFLQETPTYIFGYEDLDVNIMQERVTLYNFSMDPREEFKKAFMEEDSDIKSIKQLKVNEVTIEGISIYNFLWDKTIQISSIRIDSVSLDLLLSGRTKKGQKKEKKDGGLSLEGIRLPGIQELSLGSFALGNLTLHQMDLQAQDTLLSFTSEGGRLEGLGMKKDSEAETAVFVPDLEGLTLFLDRETLDMRKNLYRMGFEQLKYSFDSRDLDIWDVVFKPREDRATFRQKNAYSFEIYSATLKELQLLDFDLNGFLDNGAVSIRKMQLDSLDFEIFRDKTKPFDTSKQKLLLNQKMVSLDFPFSIDTVAVQNSYLKYTELVEDGKDPLVVDFSDLDLRISNLTSMTDGLPDSEPLELEIRAKLDRAIPVDVQIRMPYNTNSLTVTGRTEGTSNFANLNKTVLPAIGLQFKTGRLDGLKFEMRGTSSSLGGNLTMLYHDLDVELHKENNEKAKTLSWAANALLKKTNPNANGNTVVGEISTERVPYKGLGNFLWKGVQSGIVNSLNPFGKRYVVKAKR